MPLIRILKHYRFLLNLLLSLAIPRLPPRWSRDDFFWAWRGHHVGRAVGELKLDCQGCDLFPSVLLPYLQLPVQTLGRVHRKL